MHDLPAPSDAEPPLRRAWRIDRSAVLDLDRLAFDDFWRLEPEGLVVALHATPAVRFRIGDGRTERNQHAGSTSQASSPGALERQSRTERTPVAYAITGRAGRRGYLQRVAVHPDARRHRWGQTLVYDALRWLRHHDANRALVNTQWANEGALALYESCGFRRLPVGLCVLDRTL